MPAILSEAVPATTQNVQTEIKNTTNMAFTYTGNWYFGCISYSNWAGSSYILKSTDDFIKVIGRGGTGSHRRATHFELNFLI